MFARENYVYSLPYKIHWGISCVLLEDYMGCPRATRAWVYADSSVTTTFI